MSSTHWLSRLIPGTALVVGIGLTVPFAVLADQPAESPLAITTGAAETPTTAPVLVTATRLPDEQIPLEQLPANVSVIDRARIDASPAFTIPELLRQEVGLLPIDPVGLGVSGNVTLRGFGEKSGLLVLVDGVRMNDAGESGRPFPWNAIALADIERIEVIRGGGSTTYGEGAIAGVINIITRQPGDQPVALTVTGTGGNLGYYQARAAGRGTIDEFDYVVSLDRQAWEGWRDFSSYRGWNALVRPRFETAWGRFAFGYYLHDDTTEIPDGLTADEYAADPRQAGAFLTDYRNTVQRGTVDYEKVFESDWKLLGTIYGQQNDTDIDYWYLGSPSGSQQIEQPNYGTTWQISHDGDLGEMPNRFTLGVEAIQQDFRAESDYGFGLSVLEADNWTVSVFAQDTLTVLESLDLTAGVRYDHREWDLFVTGTGDLDRHADVWSPRLAAHYGWADRTSTWVSLSRAFRLPTGNEIGAVGVFDGQPFFPNPSIDPIAANTIEIGTRVDRWDLLGGSLVYYYSHVEDDIILNPFTFQNENFNSNRQGIELTLTSRPVEWLDLYYTTAYTDARFDGGAYDDNRLPLVPEWQLTGGVNWRPAAGWQLTFETIYLAGQRPTNDLDNLFDENEFVVCNLKIRYARDHWTVFAAANNLLDELYETYPLSNGSTTRKYNPAPGFNFQAGASVTF